MKYFLLALLICLGCSKPRAVDLPKRESYPIEVTCSNCGKTATYDVPRGQMKEDFAEEAECPSCGVKKWTRIKPL